jgi:glycosyltransferase involved in cell wall biosynthesis
MPLDVVLPAHNEGGSIGETLTEFYEVAANKHGQKIRFIVAEDGSKDNTVEVVQKVAETIPLKLISEPIRKGYSRAVIDGFRATEAPLVGFIDSDGQCDPEDLPKLLELMPDHDMVIGYRNPRSDHWIRLAMSGAFKVVYNVLFKIPFKDPSCPYLVIRRDALMKVLDGNVGILKQGFWWEFLARAVANRLRIAEVPVRHRVRASGTTQVYKPTKVPRIAAEHLVGLVKLRDELKKI